jgi:rubrerythrin
VVRVTETLSPEAQLAAERAAEVEAYDAEHPVPEPELEPEPEPEAPQPDPEIAAAAKLLEQEEKRHKRALEKALGPHATERPCDRCEGLGYIPPWIEDVGADEPEFRDHDQFQRCGACDGLGSVLTGSRRLGSELHDCPDCGARGFLEKIPVPAPLGPAPAPGNGEVASYGRPTWMGDPTVRPVYGS